MSRDWMQGRYEDQEAAERIYYRHDTAQFLKDGQAKFDRQARASKPLQVFISFLLTLGDLQAAWQGAGPSHIPEVISRGAHGNSPGARSAVPLGPIRSSVAWGSKFPSISLPNRDTVALLKGSDANAVGISSSYPPAHMPRFSGIFMQGDSADSSISAASLELQSDVLDVLASIEDMALMNHERPNTPYDVVSLGLVKNVKVDNITKSVALDLELPVDAAAAGAGDRLVRRFDTVLRERLDWVDTVNITTSVEKPSEQPSESPLQTLAGTDASAAKVAATEATTGRVKAGVGAVGHIVAVASCKGGVGKSTTAVNLAYALHASGKRVGIVDLDIHGSSLPTMVRPKDKLEIINENLKPLEADGVKLMSMGFLNAGAMPMRGARVTPVVQQLVGRTLWGELDYLIVDMPPGTGDVQLTLSQDFRVSAAVLVTTPQRLSFVDVVKGVEMFHQVGIPTIAVVENMAGLRLSGVADEVEKIISKHDISGAAASDLRELFNMPQPIFGESHVRQLKEMWGISASFSLPLLPEVAASSDLGEPLVISAPESSATAVYTSLAAAVDKEVSGLATLELPGLLYSEDENQVLIALADGSMQKISPIDLRKKCRSPSNTPDNLPADLKPNEMVTMGNYAVSVYWSDGHQSLLPYASFVQGYPA